MSELVAEGFWLVFYVSIILSGIAARFGSFIAFFAGIGLIFEALYLTTVVSVSSYNMWGVVILGFIGALQIGVGWKGS